MDRLKTQTYTKINTLYKRYMNLNKVDLPNKDWKAFQNKIILNEFSDDYVKYLKDMEWDCFSKIDGTNSKIVYYPSTGECFCGGKTDNADIVGTGQKAFLDKIIERILPTLREMFPKESAKFTPRLNYKQQIEYFHLPNKYNPDYLLEDIHPEDFKEDDQRVVILEEVPIYIYGEFYGKKIQKGGNYDKDNNRFSVFDICQQGWFVPIDLLNEYCEKLGLDVVPYIGRMNIMEAEEMVAVGFPTRVPNASNPDYIEEGIVARPVVPIKDPRGKRIIVKIKYCDYNDLYQTVNRIGADQYQQFHEWYMENKDLIESL